MKNRRVLFVSVCLLAVLGLGAWMVGRRGDSSGTVHHARLDFTTIERGPVVQSIRAPGLALITGFRLQTAAEERNRRGSFLGGQHATD